MLQSARMVGMEKPLPLTPSQIKGTPTVTISVVENTDLEDLQPPKVAGASQPTKPIKSSRQRRIRQFIFSFTRRINRIVGPKQTNKPNGSTVLWNVFGFIALLGLGSVADKVQFPAIALFQNKKWTSQATLRPKSQKCFLGWLQEDAVSCDALKQEQLVPGHSCNCKAGWTDDVIEDFGWQNTTYRYVSWRPSAKLVVGVPTYRMTLQAFFTYNASQSLADSKATQSPSLWLAIYDPQLDLTDALKMGYTRLRYRQAPNQPPAYDYAEVSLSSNQDLDIVCDTSPGKYVHPCHVTLFIQIPTFERKVIMQSPVMRWTDVAASAGAYFSFVQFVSWILSGQAMAT
ncbi:MAG: hypothetical protein Q9202_007086 [Teloschistes flavicans]